MLILKYGLATIAAYLIGSIPAGLIIVRVLAGKDIRAVGSGRTGGANALRAAGFMAGVLTGACDLSKGIAAVGVARLILPAAPVAEALSGIAAVAGHNWPLYIRFRGGAGTGPNIGAATALWPISALILIPAIPLLLITTGYASVTSTVAALIIAAIFVVRILVANSPIAYAGYAIATSLLVALALLPNYRRLLHGTERMVGPRAKRLAQSDELTS